jgi:hypothetical protein
VSIASNILNERNVIKVISMNQNTCVSCASYHHFTKIPNLYHFPGLPTMLFLVFMMFLVNSKIRLKNFNQLILLDGRHIFASTFSNFLKIFRKNSNQFAPFKLHKLQSCLRQLMWQKAIKFTTHFNYHVIKLKNFQRHWLRCLIRTNTVASRHFQVRLRLLQAACLLWMIVRLMN